MHHAPLIVSPGWTRAGLRGHLIVSFVLLQDKCHVLFGNYGLLPATEPLGPTSGPADDGRLWRRVQGNSLREWDKNICGAMVPSAFARSRRSSLRRAHPLRIRILELLRSEPLSVTCAQETTGTPGSSVPQHRLDCTWGRARGERAGRGLRSSSPAGPSAWSRRSHFHAVCRLTPTMSAACVTAIRSTVMRSTRSCRPRTVSLALRCATRASRRLWAGYPHRASGGSRLSTTYSGICRWESQLERQFWSGREEFRVLNGTRFAIRSRPPLSPHLPLK